MQVYSLVWWWVCVVLQLRTCSKAILHFNVWLGDPERICASSERGGFFFYGAFFFFWRDTKAVFGEATLVPERL